jgi:acyl carrier protein phosphodiesterase
LNYLAHAFLSFNNAEILTGNLMNDFVKGKAVLQYSTSIQLGMKLHKFIDVFTDEHSITKNLKKFFQPHYRLYAGAFIDICYDHFLALHFNTYSKDSLFTFTQKAYAQLDTQQNYFHPTFAKIFPNMKQHNWLYNYQFTWGIQRSFEGLQFRARYIDEVQTAFNLFNEHYITLEKGFLNYFPELFTASKKEYEILLTRN